MHVYKYLRYSFTKTVKKLSVEEKNKYHEENTVAAEMVLVNRKKCPALTMN